MEGERTRKQWTANEHLEWRKTEGEEELPNGGEKNEQQQQQKPKGKPVKCLA